MLGLIGAAAIGLLVGLSLEDDTKNRIVDDIKNRLYYKMMTGQEEHKPERVKPVMTYASYYNANKAKPEEEKESWEKALKFDNYRKAADFRSRLKDFVSKYGTLSVFDLCKLREMSDSTSDTYSVSWEMDKYGWTEKMIVNESTIVMGTIDLLKPVALK